MEAGATVAAAINGAHTLAQPGEKLRRRCRQPERFVLQKIYTIVLDLSPRYAEVLAGIQVTCRMEYFSAISRIAVYGSISRIMVCIR